MDKRWIPFLVLTALALGSCSPLQSPSEATAEPSLSNSQEAPSQPHLNTPLPETPVRAEGATPDQFDRTPAKLPERVPTEAESQLVTGEVPSQLLEPVLMDLAKRNGVALDSISVVRAQEMVWNDGSLGCPQPGVFYTQAIVNGFWVVLKENGQEYDYRGADTGYFFLCERGSQPAPPPGTPGSGQSPDK